MNDRSGLRLVQFFTPWRLACLLVVLLSGIVYLPSLNGLAIWDDHALIGGKGIGGGTSLAACFTEPFLLHYFRPLVSISFYLDHRLWGTGTFFYHQTNILIHMLTTAVCLLAFRAAFRSKAVAIAGALAFALQPTQVSTVAWIGGRTDSLCTLWMALFAWTLIRGAQTRDKSRSWWIAASTVSFGLALLTKEQVLAALPLVPFAFRCFAADSHRAAWRSGLRYGTPFLLTGIGFVTAWFVFYPSPHRPVVHDVLAQAALAGRTITYYTALLFLPTERWMHQLSVGTLERYGMWPILGGYTILASAIYAQFFLLRKSAASAWFLAFVLTTLLPVCNLVPLPSLVIAPYRAGVPGLGVAALLGCLFAYGVSKVKEQFDGCITSRRWIQAKVSARLALGCAFLLWCGALTIFGVRAWSDERTIFSTIVRYDPDSIVARFNLTTALLQQHQQEPAIQQLESMMSLLYASQDWRQRDTAITALRKHHEILDRVRENQGNAIEPKSWLAALYGQLGFARLSRHDRAGAQRAFEIGAAIDRTNDDVNLGIAQMAYDVEDYHRAMSYLRLAIAARPTRAESHMLMGHALAAQGKWRAARIELQEWAKLQPWSGQAYIEVAQSQSRVGDYAGARMNLQYALHHAISDTQEVRARLSDLRGRAAQSL